MDGTWAQCSLIQSNVDDVEIQRNRHLHGATGRNSPPRGTMGGFVEYSENPAYNRDSRARHPVGSAVKEWRPGGYPPDRPKYSKIDWGRPGGISHRVDQLSVDCVDFA